MKKITERIAGYVCPKTKKYIFFVCCMCLLSCVLVSVSAFTERVSNMQSGTDIRLPVLMYHSILDNESRVGKYVITPKKLEQDLQYIQRQGYTTVTVADLLAYKTQGTPLPEKPIMLTFDDGYFNNYSYLFPLLKQYNMKAVLSVIGALADSYSHPNEILNNNYSHATWAQLKEMASSGYVELQNHSYNMHDWERRKGILRKNGEDAEYYKTVLHDDLLKMQEKLQRETGVAATAFTYPFGAVSKEGRAVVESMGFGVTLGCEEGINHINRESSLQTLKRYNRAGTEETEAFFQKIEKDR